MNHSGHGHWTTRWVRLGLAALVGSPLAVAGSVAAAQPQSLEVGDGRVDGRRLRPFKATWTAESIREGRRRPAGTFEETLEPAIHEGRPAWRRTQRRNLGAGLETETVLLVDRVTLAPIRLDHEKRGHFPRSAVVKQTVVYDSLGARGVRELGDGTRQEMQPLPMGSRGFESSMLGLVLGLLPITEGYAVELPSVYAQIGEEYRLRVRVRGRQRFAVADGQWVHAWRVEVEWLNLRTNRVYAAGDTGSGGAYYVVPDPPPGFPYVARYVNENIDIVVSLPEAGG